MDIIQKINEYFESNKFKKWFNDTLEQFGYVTVNDLFKHMEQDGILAPGELYGSTSCGWTYPYIESEEES